MSFTEYQREAVSTAVYPDSMKISYPTMGLCGEAGEIANKVKKIFRDKDGRLDDITREKLRGELGDALWYLAVLSNDLGLNLGDVARSNISKLQGRKERGVLKGDGDNR